MSSVTEKRKKKKEKTKKGEPYLEGLNSRRHVGFACLSVFVPSPKICVFLFIFVNDCVFLSFSFCLYLLRHIFPSAYQDGRLCVCVPVCLACWESTSAYECTRAAFRPELPLPTTTLWGTVVVHTSSALHLSIPGPRVQLVHATAKTIVPLQAIELLPWFRYCSDLLMKSWNTFLLVIF